VVWREGAGQIRGESIFVIFPSEVIKIVKT